MDKEIIVAIISGLFVAIPSIISTNRTISASNAVQDQKLECILKELDLISKKVDTFSTDIAAIKVRLSRVEKDVDDLKRG